MAISHRNYIIFFLILFLGCTQQYNFAQSLRFNRLTVEDGLSNNDVNTLIQDKTGFIWFGTEDGLNRFDGYNFIIFRHNPADPNSLSSNVVWSLLEDKTGNIWVGTADGILNQYDSMNEKFTRWDFAGENKKYCSITALFEDQKGYLWIGTRSRGVFKFNPDTREAKNYRWEKNIPSSLSHTTVRSISEDKNGNILIGTYNGLNKFNPDQPDDGFKKFFSEKNNPNSLTNSQIYNLSVSESRPNIFWVGTPEGLTEYNSDSDSFRRIDIPNPDRLQFGAGASTVIEEKVGNENILWIDTYSGLVRMNLTSGESLRFIHDENDPNTIIDNQINKILKDRSGVLWLATENGISFLPAKSLKFNSLFNSVQSYYLKTLNNKRDLNAIYQNKNDDIWFGFSNGAIGLQEVNGNLKTKSPRALQNINAWSMIEDYKKSLWIGTFGQGLIEYNLKDNYLKEWVLRFPIKNTTTVPFVKSIFQDDDNFLWVGFWGSGLGRINLANSNYNLWITDISNSDAISHQDVWTILQDDLGRIWIGTMGGGLNLFEDKNGGKFHKWTQGDPSEGGLVSNNIMTIIESKKRKNSEPDSNTILWLGTSGGLNMLVVKNIEFDNYDLEIKISSYTVNEGLPDNSVNSILEDKSGNLWLGTGSGISYFDVEAKKFTNYSSEDGLNGKVMNPSAALLLENGLMLFGSKKGLNIFDPKQIKLSKYKPNVVITDFQIFNRSVEIGENSFLKESIQTTDEIVLPHDQDVFSFEFAALDYNSSQSIEYAYKMEGFDKDWIESGNRRFATYTNLDPGEYTFKVKSTNADGIWNDQVTSLSITIDPPWWRTLWAYGLYVVLIFLGLLGIRRFELNRTKLRNELKLREFEVQKKTELEEVKSRFFANLSHEFRTPLMLIKGPLEQLKDRRDNVNYSENINLIERNSDRLKKLIDQLLELSQLEKAAIPVKAKQEDVIVILKGLLSSFESLAEQKNISINFKSDEDTIACWIDRDKFEKIINNLLANAFKFTPEGGKVFIGVNELTKDEKKFSEIKISDTGVSIPKDKIDRIFDRFYQVDDSAQRSYGGSGVGLALVKELVDLHKWDISVQSEKGKGTEFKLLIPMCDDYLNDDEKLNIEQFDNSVNPDVIKSSSAKLPQTQNVLQAQSTSNDSNHNPSVLIVDDSEDVRTYLSGLLKDSFKISLAATGEEGLVTAAEIIPDLIISDVMMPSMDGLEFCRRIKSEWQTSEIPVILLTAKASAESKIEGLEIGADDYLTKPFDSKELFTRIRNLLEQRKRLREKYGKDLNLTDKKSSLSAADSEFLEKTLALIEKNMDRANFSTEQLAREMFVSRTQLHRKIIAITGQPPGEFVRTIKLKRSAELLSEGKLSVTQIAYEIGFSSPAQFTRAFVKQFNCVPSEYSSRQKK
ncbi:MAG: response regulator [bacterium]|nr:response regulator [bacterium]